MSYMSYNRRVRHSLAGQQVIIGKGNLAGQEYTIEDYWENVSGGSWMNAKGNPACLMYAMRTAFQEYRVPTDNEVIYGKIGGLGHLVHVSEL
mgnify:CR=1 FL=1